LQFCNPVNPGKGKGGSKARGKKNRKNRPKDRKDPLDGVPKFFIMEPRNEEVKTMDYANTGVTLADVGSVNLLNACTQGLDAVNDRIGRKVLVKRIAVRGSAGVPVASLTNGTGYENNGDSIRIVIVFDKQTNGATPTYGTGTTGVFNVNGAGNAPFGFRAQSTTERFVVLGDITRQVSEAGPNSFWFEFDIPCRLEIGYGSSNNGDVTDIVTGGIFMMVVDTNTTANLPGNYSYTSRVEFTDA